MAREYTLLPSDGHLEVPPSGGYIGCQKSIGTARRVVFGCQMAGTRSSSKASRSWRLIFSISVPGAQQSASPNSC